MCKAIIKTYYSGTRACKADNWRDGWCRFHHPDRENYVTLRLENKRIGKWLRKKHPALFRQMCDEIEEAHAVKLKK